MNKKIRLLKIGILFVATILICVYYAYGIETTFDFVETFDSSNYAINAGSTDSGCGSTTTSLVGTDHKVNICKWESYNGFVEDNETNVNDGSNKSSEITFITGVQGLSFIHYDICPKGQICSLKNDSRLIFDIDCTTFTPASVDRKPIIGFITNITGSETLPYNFNFVTGMRLKSGVAADCRISEIDANLCQNGWDRFNYSIQQILSADSDCSFNNDGVFQAFIMSLEINGADTNYYDNLQILNIYNGSNALPGFTLNTSDELLCINSPDESIQVNFTINVVDPENDTLFYATESNFGNDTIDVNFNLYKNLFGSSCSYGSLGCYPNANFDVLNNVVYPFSNQCHLQEDEPINLSNHNLLDTSGYDGDSRFVLGLNNNCSGTNKQFVYNTEVNLNPYTFDTYFLGLDSGEFFNLSFYDSSFNNKLTLEFRGNGTLFQVYTLNSTHRIGIVNTTLSSLYGSQDFGVVLSTFSDTGEISLYIDYLASTLVYTFDDIINNADDLSYIFVSIGTSTTVFMQDFSYGGTIEVFSFSTTPPNNFTVSNYGYKQFTVVVSDSEHQPNDFVYDSIDVNVIQCAQEQLYSLNESFKIDLNVFRNINLQACTLGNSIFSRLTPQNRVNWCKIVNYVFTAIAILIGLAMAVFFQLIDFGFSAPAGLIGFSLANAIFSFMAFYSTTFKIFLGLVFGIGMLMLVVRIFFSGGTSPIGD